MNVEEIRKRYTEGYMESWTQAKEEVLFLVEEIARLTTSHEAEREHLLFRLSEVEADIKKLREGIDHFVAWAITPDSVNYTKEEDAWWERERG